MRIRKTNHAPFIGRSGGDGRACPSVFAVRVRGATHFLRLTNRSFRGTDDATDEFSFLHHLYSHGVHVAMPVPSIHGENVENVGDFLATLFRRAPGLRSDPESSVME